jgi:low affinity Fe/Cu permease
VTEVFGRFARAIARLSGAPVTFLLAFLVIIVWAVSGPVFRFSDTWQLVINTGTTIVTFLMVFLIQNTQNRDSVAIQLKLDELIHAMRGARNEMIDLEEDSEEKLQQEQERFRTLAKHLQDHSGGTIDLERTLDEALDADGRPVNGASDPSKAPASNG